MPKTYPYTGPVDPQAILRRKIDSPGKKKLKSPARQQSTSRAAPSRKAIPAKVAPSISPAVKRAQAKSRRLMNAAHWVAILGLAASFFAAQIASLRPDILSVGMVSVITGVSLFALSVLTFLSARALSR